jgi:ABC-type antimicrobial peptide transport system permease subunit
MARERRVASLVAMLVGILALSLACFGIVGLVACSVSVRMKEVGIRRALGAGGRSIARLLLRQLLLPVGLGLVVGTVAGMAVASVLEGEPFYLPPVDIATLSGALGLFVLAAAGAVILPVSRALSIDPLPALRHE